MPTVLTITLPPQYSEKVKEQARKEGFKNPALWLRFLVESRVNLEESPKLRPSRVVSEMRKTGLYKANFLRELQTSLEYADKAHKQAR